MASKGPSKQATQQRQQEQQQIAFGMVQPSSSSNPGSFMNKETAGAYDLGELDQALFLYLEGQEHSSVQEQKQTLNIFPSQPMHVEPSTKVSYFQGGLSIAFPTTSASKRPSERSMELGKPSRTDLPSSTNHRKDIKLGEKRDGPRKGTSSSSEHEGPKTPDAKTLRRLAQNREAARKSRLRKKAYIQQLESSRIKLTQLEQELQRARAQGVFFGEQGLPGGIGGISSDAAVFDMEYGRWLEEHHRLMCELRAAAQEHPGQLHGHENELKMYVDNCLAHYDELMHLKSMAIKSDVFHLVSGMWKTPAERCFLWLGGFRPSDLIKVLFHFVNFFP